MSLPWRTARTGLGVLLLSAASACAFGSARAASDDGASRLYVLNRAWFDITVMVERGGHRERLGIVPSMSDRDFAMARTFSMPGAAVVLVADPVGQSQVYRSPPLRVVAGSEVFWTLKTQLDQSSVMVR